MINNMVLITGMGVISAAGNNLTETLNSFECGKRNAGQVSLFNTTLKYPAFEVKAIPDEFYLEGQRTISLALCAVDEALKGAQLVVDSSVATRTETLRGDNLSKFRVGVCMGTTVASQLNDMEFYKSYRNSGAAPLLFFQSRKKIIYP